MITRILRVHDLFNNTQNFGFLVSPGELPALKMIDFRISNDFRLCYEHFGGFLAGNGLYNYIYSHRTLRYCLHDRPVSKRVDTALHCLSQGLLRHFHQCIDQAYQDVLKYLSEANEFAESFDPFSNDLALFQVALHMNIDMFTERLERQKVCTLHALVESLIVFRDPNTLLSGQPEHVKGDGVPPPHSLCNRVADYHTTKFQTLHSDTLKIPTFTTPLRRTP